LKLAGPKVIKDIVKIVQVTTVTTRILFVCKKTNKNNKFIQLLISFSVGLELVHIVVQPGAYTMKPV